MVMISVRIWVRIRVRVNVSARVRLGLAMTLFQIVALTLRTSRCRLPVLLSLSSLPLYVCETLFFYP